MEFKKDLMEILEEMARMGNIESVAISHGRVKDYLPFLRIKFEERGLKPAPAKNLIRALQEIYDVAETSEETKNVIAVIFSEMDPRDQKNRFGECDCPTCKKNSHAKEEFLKKLKEITGVDMKFTDVDGFGEMASNLSQ